MQLKEFSKRAGLVLLNLTYGTTINMAKSIILGAKHPIMRYAIPAWNSTNIYAKISAPLIFCISALVIGPIYGLSHGVIDLVSNFEQSILKGKYESYFSFKKIFGTDLLVFKGHIEKEDTEAYLQADETPETNIVSKEYDMIIL